MALRDINWKYVTAVSTVPLVVFGSGVSLGRYISPQQGEESIALGRRLADICAGEEVSSRSISNGACRQWNPH
jgi:hypothetical protein